MYHRLGSFVSRFWPLVILFWIALAVGINQVAPKWDDVTHDGDLAYLPGEMPSVRGAAMLAQAFPENKTKSQIVVVVERDDGRLTNDDMVIVNRLAERLDPEADHGLPVVGLWTPQSDVVGDKLISHDRQAALVVTLLSNEFMATANIRVLEKVQEILGEIRRAEDFPVGLQLGLSGSAAIGGDMLTAAKESISNTELTTVVLVLVILLLVYRAPALVIIPLTTIAVSVAVATDLVALLTQANQVSWLSWMDFKIFTTTRIFVIVILFGAGTDFCLFLIARYREELERETDRSKALAASVGQVSDALVASALTTIFGLSMMYFASFGKFRNSGPAIGLCLFVTLMACMTLAPALLRAFGGVVFWPFGVRRGNGSSNSAESDSDEEVMGGWFWGPLSRGILARPGLILVASILLLAPLAYEGVSVDISYDLLSELPSDRPSVVGTELMSRHFLAGDTGPVTVLAYKRDADFEGKDGTREIALLTKAFYDIEGIESVRSIAEPLGDPPGLSITRLKKLAVLRNPHTKATFLTQVPGLAGNVARFDLVMRYDPFSPEAIDVLNQVDERLLDLSADKDSFWHQTAFDYTGTTAGTRDLKAVTESDRVTIQRLVVIAVLFILVLILRRPMICLYLILSVLFSFFVTIGATEVIFSLINPEFDGLDWKVPIFLFVILIAVGEDYNIYLATRVFEEQKKRGPREGLRVAIVRTGGIITSCGIIMAGTFISMMTGTLWAMRQLGFALSLGVILDTFVVRPILVPAFLALLYRDDARIPPAEPLEEAPAEREALPIGKSHVARGRGAASR